MSSETGALSLDLPDAYYRRLFALIPARSLESILNALSAVWCEATGADAAYIAVFDRRPQQLTGSIYRSSRNETECFVLDAMQPAHAGSESEQAISVFEQGRSFSLISPAPFEFYSIPSDQADIAGVFLFSSNGLTEKLPLISQLVELSQRLLAQVRESKQPSLSDVDTKEVPAGELGQKPAAEHRVFPSVDKLEAMAEFSAGAGHEINNPVATIVGRVQMLLKGETDPDRRQSLTTIGGQAYRVRDMIGDAMLFGRPPVPHPSLLNLQKTVAEVLASLNETISPSGIQISVEISESHSIWADETQWKVVLSNLILNSLNVLEVGGQIRIVSEESITELTTGSNRSLHLRVIDDGPGLTDQEREHLFDPFFSARQAGRGLGFGLSKCWRIVSLHGGSIEAEINPDRGVTFHLVWPAEIPAESENK
ncbi:HAMP domain-containing sensor histidine kinase [uncultured Gimesia sp.]|uniref:sensor histidine kinase n=1 Tax=uncultured Gimesia sp. TaxID=1678688 RepID=UPI0030D87806|tara:strand:- start:119676 stop:120950 length:1275 start_codon:yes stop_codon:yes gene_type:complete